MTSSSSTTNLKTTTSTISSLTKDSSFTGPITNYSLMTSLTTTTQNSRNCNGYVHVFKFNYIWFKTKTWTRVVLSLRKGKTFNTNYCWLTNNYVEIRISFRDRLFLRQFLKVSNDSIWSHNRCLAIRMF